MRKGQIYVIEFTVFVANRALFITSYQDSK